MLLPTSTSNLKLANVQIFKEYVDLCDMYGVGGLSASHRALSVLHMLSCINHLCIDNILIHTLKKCMDPWIQLEPVITNYIMVCSTDGKLYQYTTTRMVTDNYGVFLGAQNEFFLSTNYSPAYNYHQIYNSWGCARICKFVNCVYNNLYIM